MSEPTGVSETSPPLLTSAHSPHSERQITSLFTWSIIVQTDTNHRSIYRHPSTSPSTPIHSRLPLWSSYPVFFATSRRRATLTHEIPQLGHPICSVESFCPRITEFRWRLHIPKPTQAIQPHDLAVPQRPTGPVLHNGRKVRLTGFDTVPADLVILLGLILESGRNATQLT